MSETVNEISSIEDNSAKNNSKKRKTEEEDIEDIAEKIHKRHLKLNEEEIKKFLLIFQELISIANKKESCLEESLEEEGDSFDGTVSILLILAQQFSELLEGDVDSLEFPKIIKKLLKSFEAILRVFNTGKNNIKSKLKTNGKN